MDGSGLVPESSASGQVVWGASMDLEPLMVDGKDGHNRSASSCDTCWPAQEVGVMMMVPSLCFVSLSLTKDALVGEGIPLCTQDGALVTTTLIKNSDYRF